MNKADMLELVEKLFDYMRRRLQGRLFAMAVLETVRMDVLSGGMTALMNYLKSHEMGRLFEDKMGDW